MTLLFSGWVDVVMACLWRLTEESFWQHLFGERLFNLIIRYFGNDVVLCGMLFYIIPLISAPFNKMISSGTTKFYGFWYSTIKINQKETAVYNAIQGFIASQLDEKDFRNVEAKIVEEVKPNDYYDEREGPQQVPKLELFPSEKNQQFHYKGHKIWITVGKEAPDSFENVDMYGSQLSDVLNMMNQVNVMSVTMKTRQTSLLHTFLEEWIEIQHKKKHGQMTIYKSSVSRYSGSTWIQVGTKALRSFDSVILKNGQKETLLKDIQLFRQREQWYAKLGLPYRRGYLLYGHPGTGKTSLVQSIASKLNMNLAILSVNSQTDDELIQYLLRTMPYNSILLIEDIDHCAGFKAKSKNSTSDSGNSNDSNQSQLTMTGILNALDGVTAQEGSMIFMSCNNMDDIEPALLRPGRIDMKMFFGYADREQIKAMYHRFMDKTDGDDDDGTPNIGIELDANNNVTMMKTPSASSSISTSSTVVTKDTENDKKDTVVIANGGNGGDSDDHTIINDADRFANAIPSDYVTPAELQNFFICNLDDIGDSPDPIQCILDRVPPFLETVKADRSHAEKHQDNGKSKE